MKKRDLHKIIRESDKAEDARLADVFRNKYPELTANTRAKAERASSPRRARLIRAMELSPLAVFIIVAVTLLSVCFVNDRNYASNAAVDPYIEAERDHNYFTSTLNCTVQEYGSLNNRDILYYSGSDFRCSGVIEYMDFNTLSFAGLQAGHYDTTGRMEVVYYVCYAGEPLGFLHYEKAYTDVAEISGRTIRWGTHESFAYGNFRHGDYEYFVTVRRGDVDTLFDFVADMFK